MACAGRPTGFTSERDSAVSPLTAVGGTPGRWQDGHADHPDGLYCPSCEHETARGEGPAAIPSSVFSVGEVARVLVLVGEGKSLREAGQKVRYSAGKFATDRMGRRWASRENALAADYLDQFGPVVVRGMTPRRWPRVLILDSLPLALNPRGAANLGHDPGRRGGAVLVAAGRDRGQARTRCWLAGLAGDDSAGSWFEFLDQLDDDPPPFWVVADGSKAIRNAVEAKWPEAIFYPCEHHLRERAMEHATLDGALGEPGLVPAIERAFHGIEAWEELGAIVRDIGPSHLMSWWFRTDPDARNMAVMKHRYGDYPRGNGPAERATTAIRERIGMRRRNFGNAYRLATLIALMGIDLAEQASETTYARVLRGYLAERGWRSGADWEAPHDGSSWGHTSLAELIMAAWEREASSAAGAMADAVAASFARRLAVVNLFHEASGLPPLTSASRPGAVPSISVQGRLLRDFPMLLAEWDADANPGVADPSALPAGSSRRVGWVCHKGHRWQAVIRQRATRTTRCRLCHRQWATPKTSIAGLHPGVLSERDPANAPRTPERTKATSDVMALWKCAVATHPAYAMTPLTRCRRDATARPGCPECVRAGRISSRAKKAKPRS